MRLTRTQLLEVLRQDYVRTAWSKGLAGPRVVLKHGLKNALIPVVTVLGIQIAQILSGTVIFESIFGLPGMGRFLFDAITERDYPVIQGINLVIVATVVLVNLVVDVAYAWLDPRIRYWRPWRGRSRSSRSSGGRSAARAPARCTGRSSAWRGSAGGSRSGRSAGRAG